MDFQSNALPLSYITGYCFSEKVRKGKKPGRFFQNLFANSFVPLFLPTPVYGKKTAKLKPA
jgi:hypothetical protein